MKMKLERRVAICALLIIIAIIILGFGPSGHVDIQIKPKIVFGDDVNYPPYSYVDKKGAMTGFNVELAKAAGQAMGYDVEIRLDEWGRTRKALENGKIDVISGMFFSEQREKQYDFTVRHSITSGDIFTRNGLSIHNIKDLKNKTVVVQKGDIVGEYLAEQRIGIKLIEVASVREALMLIEIGQYDYAGLLKLPGLYTIKEEGFQDVKDQGMILHPNNYCMAVAKGNETMLMTLNDGLQKLKVTGEYKQIYDKWLGVYEETTPINYLQQYKWFFIILFITIVGLVGINALLRAMVNRRTRELNHANQVLEMNQEQLRALNEEMEASMEELIAMEEELRENYDNLVEGERRLKLSEERSKAIINALPDIVFVLDGEGVFLDCQVNNESALLVPKSEFLGKQMDSILPEEIAKHGLEQIKMAIQTNELQRYEYELVMNGERQIFEMRIVKSRDNEVICITRNISQDTFYREKIEYLSYHDQLTGLFNRRFFEEELQRLDVPRNYPLCIIMGDVNGLKLVNDSFGHKMGDELLIKVAEVLRRACRSDEIISRIGGDEFVILIPRMEYQHAETLIERVMEISQHEKVGSIGLSISFGWEVKRNEEEDIQELFNRAEDYMYKRKLFDSPSIRGKTIHAIINTLHEKNHREEQHSKRVSDLCRKLAIVLGLPDQEVEEIKTAGLLHDIGKIAISEEILNSPNKLTSEEYDEIKRHSEVGYRILSSVNDMNEMSEYVLYHHERWDGNGYPRGLKGEEIPFQSRMICIADAFDAITSDRSYRPGSTEEKAVQELRRSAGTQFDPKLVELFIREVLGKHDQ